MEFLVYFNPFEVIITKTKPKLCTLHSHVAKLWVLPAKNNEIGKLLSVFQYPFEDDIPKQNQNIWSMFTYHLAKLEVFFCKDISEVDRLFSVFQYPFEDDIPKQNQNIWSMFTYHLAKLEVFFCKDISEVGRLFSVFLYPFEDDILKQNQNVLSMFTY